MIHSTEIENLQKCYTIKGNVELKRERERERERERRIS